jgi:predicted nucleotidyltransferase
MDNNIREVLEKIYKESKAVSVFVYGSRARKDFKETSDYEIGILYKKENKVSRSEIAKLHSIKGMNIYPFIIDNLEKYDLDTPFPKAIYLRELIGSSKTIFGKKILEEIELPEITLIDLLERASFDLATAFAAVRSFRRNDLITTSINLKSALFGVRVLEILELNKFPFTYDEIFELSKKLDLSSEYKEVVNHAYKVRQGEKIKEQFLFKNISFLNQVVLKKIKKQLYEEGNKTILPGKNIRML